MTWQQLLTTHRVQPHATSRHELYCLRAVVARDLSDAQMPGLSTNRQFATTDNAALQLPKMAIACAGYRVVGQGHHVITFAAVELAMGRRVAWLASYFETCRRKRNMLDYDTANVATDTEVHELLEKAHAFRAARRAVDGAFDARVGGGYRMSLFYPSPEQVYRGKTSEREDHFTARFVELTPPTRIVQAISFDSVDPAFSGEMTMVVTFEERDGGTAVTIVFEHIPSGIRPEDNEAGCRSSLEKLARYLE